MEPLVSSKRYEARSPAPAEDRSAGVSWSPAISVAVSARDQMSIRSKAPAKTGSAGKCERPSQWWARVPSAAGLRVVAAFRPTAAPLT